MSDLVNTLRIDGWPHTRERRALIGPKIGKYDFTGRRLHSIVGITSNKGLGEHGWGSGNNCSLGTRGQGLISFLTPE